MKRFITLFFCSALVCLSSMFAQKINGDFDSEWVVDTKGNGALPGMYLRPGTQPFGWEASNVHQKVLLTVTQQLIFPDENRTDEPGFSVRMENKTLGVSGLSSGAPGYITLGVPWVYAVLNLAECDGGTVGGMEYQQRPDSLVGYYKRKTVGEEDALLLVYLWKGTSISTVKTNSSGSTSSKETKQVVDQDVCILGKKEADESNVVLIGKAEYNITTDLDEWTRISIPIEYYTDDTPEKMNIVISAAGYWDRASIVSGNMLWADDVELVCNAELKKLTIGGVELEGFSPKIYDYSVWAGSYEGDIVAEGQGANSVVNIQKEGNVATIVVTDETANGQKSYTYKITFAEQETVLTTTTLPETIVYGQEIDFQISSNNPNPLHLHYSDSTALRLVEGKLKFLKAGKASLILSQEGDEDFNSIWKEIEIDIEKAPLTVGLKDVTSKLAQSAVYEFTYEGWVLEDEALVQESLSNIFSKVPQASGYNGRSKVTSTTPMGEYPIQWTQTPEAYNYEITVDTEEKTLTIGKGLVTISYQVTRDQGQANPEITIKEMVFSDLLSTDRTRNSSTNTYYIKDGVATGTVTAEFEGTAPDEDSPAGVYPVILTSTLSSDKYDFQIAEGNSLMVRGEATLEIVNFPETISYGDSIKIELETSNTVNPTFTYSVVSQDEESDPVVTFEGSTMIAVGTGTAKIEVTVNASGPYLKNTISKEFEVKKRRLDLYVGDYTRDPGEENPEFVITYAWFAFDEDESILDEKPIATTEATIDSPAGFYEVRIEGGVSKNYEFNPENGELSVLYTPIMDIVNFPQTVHYGDRVHIEYELINAGDLIPMFYAVQVDSVKNVEFLSGNNSPKMTAVGVGRAKIEAFIEPTGLYRGSYFVLDFEVTKRELIVIAKDTTRLVGESNPEFVLKYDGFVFDDSEDKEGVFVTPPTVMTDADENSPTGYYDLIVIPGEAKNYEIIPINGELEVKVGTGVPTTEMGTIEVYSGIESITIKGNEDRDVISVYDTLGTLITTRSQSEVTIDGLIPNTIYIVKVGNKAVRVLVK